MLNKAFFLIIILFNVCSLYSEFNMIHLARVQYDGGGDWYNDPEVLPNFADFIRKNLPVNISNREKIVKFSDADLFQYPFLYLTGHGNIVVSDTEVSNLRKYLLAGGFLYVDDDFGLDVSFRSLVTKVFPEKSLVELPVTHPIFSSYYQFPQGLPKIHEHDNQRPQLFAVFDDSGRIMILYTYESNITDGWADPQTHDNPEELRMEAFKFGLNIFYYLFTEGN